MTQELKMSITSLAFAIGCLALYFFFPIGNLKFEIFVGAVSFLLVLPILYTKYILKKDVRSLGFTSFSLELRDIFYLASTVVIGGLVAFFVFTLGWGVPAYVETLSVAILQNFGAFAIYELVFMTIALFLITFFVWGFIYSIPWANPIYSFVSAFVIYDFLLVDFYDSFWVAIPFLVPAFFVPKIRNNKNIVYMFAVVFLIGLIFDTLIVKSFN
jgi:magnesium-transporting ATPase (P-type)